MSGAFKVGGITADINLDANPALAAMAKAKKEAQAFVQEGKRASSHLTKAMDDAKRSVVGYDNALRAGREGLQKLEAQMNQALEKRGKLGATKRIEELQARIEATKKDLREIAAMRVEAVATAPSASKSFGLGLVSDAKASALAYGTGFLAVGAAAEAMRRMVTASVSATIRASMELETAQVEMAKTVDGTQAELDAMTQQIVDISLRSPFSANSLLRGAGLGAQLGIEKQNLVEFTEVMHKLEIATDLTAETGATGFAQWANITGLAQDRIKNLANVIVDLGQNSAATESGILGMGMRLASAATQAGFLDEQTVALGATLKSLGLEEEMGGTAFSRILGNISKAVAKGGEEVDLFAQISQKSSEQFVRDWKENAAGAIVDFLRGMKSFSESGGNMFLLSDALGFDDMRVGDALRRAANGAELFERMLGRANEAMKDTASLDSEYKNFADTFESSLHRLDNAFTDLKATIGDEFKPTLKEIVKIGSNAISVFSSLEKSVGFISGGARGAFSLLGGSGILGIADAKNELATMKENAEKEAEIAERSARFWEYRKEMIAEAAAAQQDLAAKQESAADAERQGFLRLSEAIKGGTEDLAKMAKSGEDLWRKLHPDMGMFDAAKRGLEDLKAAGKLSDESANLLGQMIWREMGKNATEQTEIAISMLMKLGQTHAQVAAGMQQATLDAIGAALDQKIADGKRKSYERERDARIKARLQEEQEAQQAAEKSRQNLESLTSRLDPIGTAINQLQNDMNTLDEGGRFEMFAALADQFFSEHKDAPEIIDAAIGAIREESIAMDTLGVAMLNLRDRLKELRQEQQWLSESDFMDKFGAINSNGFAGQDLYNRLHANDPASIARSIGGDMESLGGLLGQNGTGTLLADDYWDHLSAAARENIDEIIAKLKELPEGATEGGQEVITEFERLSEAEKKAFQIQKLNAYADGIGGIGAQLAGLGPEFQDAAKAAQVTSATIHLVTSAMSGDILGVVSAVIELASAFGLFGDTAEKEAHGIDKVFEEVKDNIDGWIDDLSNRLVDFAATGEATFREFVQNVIQELASIATAELIIRPIVNFGGDVLGFSKGGVFDQYKNVVPFAKGGHVTNGPEYFKMGGGRVGVRGEAGNEAVIPLERMPGGDLGVKANLSGGSGPNIQIIDQRSASAPPIEYSETTGPDGEKILRAIVRDAIHSELNRGGLDRALERNYGVRRAGGL